MRNTTVKTENFKINGKIVAVMETIYKGNQEFTYKINGKVVPAEFFFECKNWHLPTAKLMAETKQAA